MIISPLQNTGIKLTDWIQKRPYITQSFGKNPQIYSQFGLKGHNGVDFRAKAGTMLYAPFEGKVRVRNDGKSGYGLHIKIRGSDRECVLGHLSRCYVLDGEDVRMGQLIAETGNTGFSTGPHLHFGLRQLIKGSGNIFSWAVRDYDNGYFGYYDPAPYTIAWKGSVLGYNV